MKLFVDGPPVHQPRKNMFGAGIGKIWMVDDAFSPETDELITEMFEAHNPDDDPA